MPAAPYLLLFARWTLAGVFLLGAAGKWLDRGGTAATWGERAWLPPILARGAAVGLPWIEAALGLLLLLGFALQAAAGAAALLLVVFTAVLLGDLRGGRAMPCQCFGRFSHENISAATVARDLGLLALATLLVWDPSPYMALDGGASSAALPPAGDAVPVFFLAVAVVILIVLGGSFRTTIRSFLRAF